MADKFIQADGFRSGSAPDGSRVFAIFTEGEDTYRIAIPSRLVQTVVDDLENASGSLSVSRISQEELARSKGARIVGRNVRTYSGNQKQLVLLIDVGGRTRSFPVNLSANDIQALIADLSRW